MKFIATLIFLFAGIAVSSVAVMYLQPPKTEMPAAEKSNEAASPPAPLLTKDEMNFSVLLERLENAEQERDILFSQIKELNNQLATLNASDEVMPPSPDNLPNDSSESDVFDSTKTLIDNYLDAGFDENQASDFIRRTAEIDMDRLYLRDQAARENWLGTDRYRDALRELNNRTDALRNELGDDDYDRYLYASGDTNRVRIDTVIDGSPAQLAGLKPGDTIRGYNDAAIFSVGEVQSATRSGEYGELIRVEIERDGDTFFSYIPRGPLGVNLRGQRQQPG